jgi:glycosyltransferase involved in cell wall biosynthesis
VSKAALIITNTEESRAQFVTRYPQESKKFRTITNGFDFDAVPPAEKLDLQTGALELLHFGTVYGQRSPRQLLAAIDELNCKYGNHLSSRLTVRFVGGWEIDDPAVNVLADKLERAHLIMRVPAIPYEECLGAMRRAQVLLVLQPGSPVQIPGKLYEYVASGRPLLLIGGEGATASLVDRYRLGLSTTDQKDDIAGMLERLIARADALPIPSVETIARFDYRRLTGELAGELRALV